MPAPCQGGGSAEVGVMEVGGGGGARKWERGAPWELERTNECKDVNQNPIVDSKT